MEINHVHSIVKNKRLKDEKLEREYPEVWSDFSMEVIDKTLVNMFAHYRLESLLRNYRAVVFRVGQIRK